MKAGAPLCSSRGNDGTLRSFITHSFVELHRSPDVVRDAPFQTAHGLVVALSLRDLPVVVAAVD